MTLRPDFIFCFLHVAAENRDMCFALGRWHLKQFWSPSHRKAHLPGVQPGKNQKNVFEGDGYRCLYVCVYGCMSIPVHTCSAIPAKNDAELGDDNNDIMAFNMLGRVHKQTYTGTHVTASSAKHRVSPAMCWAFSSVWGCSDLWFQALLSTEASVGVNQHPRQ